MADFKKRFGGAGGHHGKFSHGGGRSFDNKRGGGFGRDRGNFGGQGSGAPVTLYETTCADCGKTCEVPFRPNGDKPVYCRDCFGDKKDMPSRDFRDSRPQRTFGKKEFAPRPSFAHQAPQHDSRIDDLGKRIDSISAKLEKLIGLLEEKASPSMPVAETKQAAAKKETPKKAAPKAAAKKAAPKKKAVAKKK